VEKFEGENVIAAACSDFHGVAVLENRRVYTWGVNCVFNAGDDYNDGVLLGYNTSDKGVDRGFVVPEKVLWTEPKPQLIPRAVTVLDRCSVRQVACGSGHTLALTDGGDVYSWGYGWGGCLGHGKQQHGKVVSISAPSLVKGLSDMHIIQVACGAKHSMTVTTTGYLFGWGDNEKGQLGNGRLNEAPNSTPTLMKFLIKFLMKFRSCLRSNSILLACR